MKSTIVFALFCLCTPLLAEDLPVPKEPVNCLKGLDPVALTQGKELAGDPKLTMVRGLYRYAFASAENKALFEKQPDRYAIQMGGSCGRMGPLSGLGDANRFWVFGEKIYIFASEQCLAGFQSAPEKLLEVGDPPLMGSEEEIRRGKQLIERAVAGLGGAAKLDAVESYQTRRVQKYKSGDREIEYITTRAAAFPDRFYSGQHWPTGAAVHASRPAGGFRVEGEAAWAIDEAERMYFLRDFQRNPLMLLKSRTLPDFKAVAAGKGKAADEEVDLVLISLRSAVCTLGLDVATGRVLSLGYRGRAGGIVGNVVKLYSDFREVDGLTVPFAAAVELNGKAVAPASQMFDSITFNKVEPALFENPR